MSVDLKYLKTQGISSGHYKKIFSAPPAKYPKRVRELVTLISQRCKDAKYRNFREWRTYAAIDFACQIPFRQTTATFVNHILSKNLDGPGTLQALRDWGLGETLITKTKGDDGKEVESFDIPVFYQVFVPLCMAYMTIRLAKLFNERNESPLLQYKPLKETTRNEILCEITTDLINTISTWFGYPATLRQAIRQTLKYGVMLAFPREEWYSETQTRLKDDGETETYTVKEGIRYVIPHPTRMYYDPNYPLTSINSDTGCEYYGCWFVRRYGDILDNKDFWNRDKIFVGTNWLDTQISGNYFEEFFPCRLNFPSHPVSGPPTREDDAAYYNSGNRDQAIFLTEHFEKIAPGDWGLGEYSDKDLKKMVSKPYREKVWHRFTLAGDDTVVFCEPCAYTPAWAMGYDLDENASRHSSLVLEVIPWQDELGNILSQMIRTAKQNLANATFYDNQIVDKEDIDRLRASGNQKYEGWNFIGFDSSLRRAAGNDVKTAFFPVNFIKQPMNEQMQLIPLLLNLLERVLQISAQEAGGSASHQQSKEEVIQTAGTSQNRVIFTGAGIDEGVDAWKRQLVDGSLAYQDPTILVQISTDVDDLEEHLKEIGFKIVEKGKAISKITGPKKVMSRVRLEGFASANQGPQPGKEKEIAQIIFQTVGTVAGQPELFKKIGAENLLRLVEEAAKLAGAPRDFKLNTTTDDKPDEEIPETIKQALMQAQQATLQAVEQKIGQPAAKEMAQLQQEVSQMQQLLDKMKGIYTAAEAQQSKDAQAQAKLQIKDRESRAADTRKDKEVQNKIERENALTGTKIKTEELTAHAKVAIHAATAAHSAAIDRQAADAAAATAAVEKTDTPSEK